MATKIADLTEGRRRLALQHFRKAVACRINQWRNEAEIEKLLGREIDVAFDELAAATINPSRLTVDDMRAAIEHNETFTLDELNAQEGRI